MLAELALRLHARRVRLRQCRSDIGVGAGLDLLARIVAAIGYGLELVDAKHGLGLFAHVGELCPIRAAIRHFVRDDEVVLGIDGNLHIVADDAGTTPARRHRTAVGIGQ